jgi:hypothetical protein
MNTTEENAKIATLTSDAVRVSGEKVVKDIRATIDAAEQTAQRLREDGETLIAEIEKHTTEFANRVNAYVTNCHAAVDMLQTHQSKIFDDADIPLPTSNATERLRELPVLITQDQLTESNHGRRHG